MSSSQNQFYFHINKSFRTIFFGGNPIDHQEIETKRCNFEFWDRLINKIPSINKTVPKDGIDTIKFENYPYPGSMNRNSGFNFSDFGYGGVPTVYNIKGVDAVYQLVNNLRKDEVSLND